MVEEGSRRSLEASWRRGQMFELCPSAPQASLSMDEAARQTSSHSLSSASSSTSAPVRRSASSQRQHRRTGSVGTVSEHEVTTRRTGHLRRGCASDSAPWRPLRCAPSSTPRAPPSPPPLGFPSTRRPPWTLWTASCSPVNRSRLPRLEQLTTVWRYRPWVIEAPGPVGAWPVGAWLCSSVVYS